MDKEVLELLENPSAIKAAVVTRLFEIVHDPNVSTADQIMGLKLLNQIAIEAKPKEKNGE